MCFIVKCGNCTAVRQVFTVKTMFYATPALAFLVAQVELQSILSSHCIPHHA